MNHKPQTLPGFTSLAALAGFVLGTAACASGFPAIFADESPAAAANAADEPKTTAESPATVSKTEAPANPAAVAILPKADEILTQLRSKLESLDSLKCDLHQTTLIAGMKLTASGKYVEASGNRVSLQYVIYPMSGEKLEDAQQLALDAVTPVPDEKTNRGILIQVSDGQVLSTSWKNGETQRISRRNIRDVLAAAEATKSYDPKNAAMDLGVGGLRGLVSRLQTTMEFAPVKLIKVGERSVYEVTGRWSEKVRKEIFKVPEDSIIDPRPEVPEYVRVYVDVESMLPRRIQFLKRSLSPAEKLVRPLITLDLRNMVVNEAVEDATFVFQTPEGAQEEDQTEQVIQMIQQSIQADATLEAAPSAPAPAPK